MMISPLAFTFFNVVYALNKLDKLKSIFTSLAPFKACLETSTWDVYPVLSSNLVTGLK